MNKLIIYNQDNGIPAVIIPTQEALDLYGIDAIALKDVPHGKPYKIVSDADIPTDRTFRAAWTIDDALLTDGVGSGFNSFDNFPPHKEV